MESLLDWGGWQLFQHLPAIWQSIIVVALLAWALLSEILPFITKERFPWCPEWISQANNVIQAGRGLALYVLGKKGIAVPQSSSAGNAPDNKGPSTGNQGG